MEPRTDYNPSTHGTVVFYLRQRAGNFPELGDDAIAHWQRNIN